MNSETSWSSCFRRTPIKDCECSLFLTMPSTIPQNFRSKVVIKPGLTSQKHSALISSDSEYFQVCFSAVHYLKISEQRWFSSEQRWKRKFSELKISAESELFQRWFSLKQSWFSLKQRWNTKFSEQKNQRWIRAVSALIFSETELIFSETALKHQIFRAKKSALNQSCFSADILWNRAEQRWFSLTQRWKTKNPEQGKSAESVLFQRWFSLKELIPTEAFLNSSHHSWFSPETTLNIPRHLILFPQTSAGKLRS